MNALILAAGMGTRLRPFTENIPKCLVPVNGTPIIERQITFLKEKGIQEITVVSGYKADRLNYLISKYGIEIVLNENYARYNNIYSLYSVLDRFGDTYIIEGDVWMEQNCFRTDLEFSTYFACRKEFYRNEWGLIINEEQKLKSIVIGDGTGYLMSGISYWKKEDCNIIASQLRLKIRNSDFEKLYWDHIVLDVMNQLTIQVLPVNGIYEIDTVTEWHQIQKGCPSSRF